jgi:DNA (cytosine-5)-methyltransferase 1
MKFTGYKMKDVHGAESKKLFTVFSCFAGMGGSSTGYRLAGGDVLGANEFMPEARKIYSTNYPHTVLFPEDIRKLTAEHICEKLNIKPGELDILDGSPPCASFSVQNIAGRTKHWGKEKKYSSTKQRVDDLFFEFARLLREMQPKTFVAENVKGLTMLEAKSLLGTKSKSLSNFAEGMEREKIVDENDTIVETLRACGYRVSFKVLHAANYGVPQKRERLIFIGVRNDLNIKPSFPKIINFDDIIAKDSIDHLMFNGSQFYLGKEIKKYTDMRDWIKPLATRNQIFHIVKDNGLTMFESAMDRSGWFQPGKTVLQADPGLHAIIDRYESIEEVKRIQTFPDDMDLILPYVETKYMSINEIKNLSEEEKNNLANFDAGCPDNIDELLKIAKINIDHDEKYFRLDFKSNIDRQDANKPSKSREFIGRAVPPIMMKAIATHVYENILRRI